MRTPRCPRCLNAGRHLGADRYICETSVWRDEDSDFTGRCGPYTADGAITLDGDPFGLRSVAKVPLPPELEYVWYGRGGQAAVLGVRGADGKKLRDPVVKVACVDAAARAGDAQPLAREALVLRYLHARATGDSEVSRTLLRELLDFQQPLRSAPGANVLEAFAARTAPVEQAAPWPAFRGHGTALAGRLHYIVMEGIGGDELLSAAGRLEDFLPRTIGFWAYVQAARRLARAVAMLHGEGLVHGDIKPSNVLYETGEVVLVDLGAAAVWLPGLVPARARFVTPGYAPERPELDLSPAWDVHCLGRTLLRIRPRPEDLPELEQGLAARMEGDLLRPMTAREPMARPSMDRICEWLERIELELDGHARGTPSRVRDYLASFQDLLGPRAAAAGIGHDPLLCAPLSLVNQRQGALALEQVFSACAQPVVAIIGDSGAGKTIMLRRIWGQGIRALLAEHSLMAEQAVAPAIPFAERGCEVPVYLRMGEDLWRPWQRERKRVLDIAACVAERFPELAGVAIGSGKTRWLLLLDGLDQVPQADRAEILEALTRWLETVVGSGVRCLVTSRASGWPGWPGSSFGELALAPLAGESLEAFVRAHEKALGRGLDTRRLLRDLERDSRLLQSASSPGFCAMLCRYHATEGAPPAGVAAVYEEATGRAIRRLSPAAWVDPAIMRRIAIWLAYTLLDGAGARCWSRRSLRGRLVEMLEQAQPAEDVLACCTITFDDVEEMLASMPGKPGVPQELAAFPRQRQLVLLARHLLEQLTNAAGVLVRVSERTSGFIDPGWQAFLASAHVQAVVDASAPAPRREVLRGLARRCGFDVAAHRFDVSYEGFLLFVAEAQRDSTFIDALWRVNKSLALQAYAVSSVEARPGSIIDRLLQLEQRLDVPRLRDLRHFGTVDWNDLLATTTAATIDEAFFRGDPASGREGLVPAAEDVSLPDGRTVRLVREDGTALYFISRCLECLDGGPESWSRRLVAGLFARDLDVLPGVDPVTGEALWVPVTPDSGDDNQHGGVLVYAYPVTCAAYELLDPYHERPPWQTGGEHPVVLVTFVEALMWAWRNGYNLPTVGEWSSAAWRVPRCVRANGTIDLGRAWFDQAGTSPVRDESGFPARPAGAAVFAGGRIYDLHGNVWEWCHGNSDKRIKPACGGSWDADARFISGGLKEQYTPANRLDRIGFRVIRRRP